MADLEIEVIGRVVDALAELPDDDARQRVVSYASSKFKLTVLARGGGGGKGGGGKDGAGAEIGDDEESSAETDAAKFFSNFEHDKPAENVLLIAAFLYSQFGGTEFTLAELRETASDTGLTIPERPDMTLEQASRDGKKLFRRAGKGRFKPTVHGEAYFKTTYRVKKGKKTRTSSDASE